MRCAQVLRNWTQRTFVWAWTLLLLTPMAGSAHADLLLQIEELTKQIASKPAEAELYVRRGELRRLHFEWDLAFADYQHAATLSPDLAVLDLMRGRLFLESGWPLSARACLDRYLTRQPKNSDAFVTRSRVFRELRLYLSAAADLDRAIALAAEPGPDLYIERAQMLSTQAASTGSGQGPEQLARALQGLDDGIRKLGPLVTLQLYAIEIEMKTRNFDGALTRIDRIAERSPRKETWLSRKGEILQQAGRTDDAHKTYQDALAALQTLPPVRRQVPAILALEKKIRREIEVTSRATP